MNRKFNIKKYAFGSATLALILGFGFYISPIQGINTRSQDENIATLDEETKLKLNLDDPSIRSLLDLYSQNDSLINILNNTDKIPSDLLKLAANNNETLNFVSNYINHTSKSDISIEEDYTPGEIPLFLQWDERWGYHKYADNFMAINGCAPTTLAMVAVGLTGDTSINPQVVVDYSYENGYYVDDVGTSWNLISEGARHFGLNSKHIYVNEDSIISTLEKGHPVIASVKPGVFTTTGHFLVVTGINEDGTLKINDPNSIVNSHTNWDVDVFLKEAKGLWEMSI